MKTSEQINELAAALAKAQKVMKGAKKDSANPFFKSRYADLASVADACRDALADHGIAVVQTPSTTDDGRVSVETMLVHESGQWVSEVLSTKPKDDGPQALGSVITYLRRYALAAMAGVAPEDDDAEAAEGRRDKPVVVKVVKPEGYDEWLEDMAAVADQGTVALQAAWKASKAVYREYIDPKVWAGIKARASKVAA